MLVLYIKRELIVTALPIFIFVAVDAVERAPVGSRKYSVPTINPENPDKTPERVTVID